MALHEWFPPLHEPLHVVDPHIETHLWEPADPPLHAILATSQATTAWISPHQILYHDGKQPYY
jgi:hypothetical protein